MTTETRAMILSWLNGQTDSAAIERVAKYMRDTLRIGGLRACRTLIQQALGE